MLISYEEKLRIAQESLRQPSVNQIAEATGIHRSVVQKALNDPEIIELQETLKIHLRSRYVNSFAVDTPACQERLSQKKMNQTRLSQMRLSQAMLNQTKLSHQSRRKLNFGSAK